MREMPNDSDTFEEAMADLLTAIDLTFEKKTLLPMLMLVYATIDILGWLDRPANVDNSTRKDFMAWANEFLLPEGNVPATAEDLYAARCGVLHAHSFESSMTKQGKARQIFYSHGSADHGRLAEIASRTPDKVVAVKIEHLVGDLKEAINSFRSIVKADPNRAGKVYGRAKQQFYSYVPSA